MNAILGSLPQTALGFPSAIPVVGTMVYAPMQVLTPTVLLYSPRIHRAVDYQGALAAAGYRVLSSRTIAGCRPFLDGGADLVVLDDPPWELARGLVTALDVAPLPLPRLWVSSWSLAPAMAGKLGVDGLLLDPHDTAALVQHVSRILAPARPNSDDVVLRRPLARAGTTAPELHPGGSGRVLDRFDDETSGSWP